MDELGAARMLCPPSEHHRVYAVGRSHLSHQTLAGHLVRGLVTTHLTRLTGPDETVLAGHARVGLALVPTDKPVHKQLNI